MRTLLIGGVLSVVVAMGCSGSLQNPVAPTYTEAGPPNVPPITGKWPVLGSNGFGSEDANYPPTGTQCPISYDARFNGHNFICVSQVGNCTIFPKQEGYGLYSPFKECKTW